MKHFPGQVRGCAKEINKQTREVQQISITYELHTEL